MKKTKNMYVKETAESRELTIFIENNADLYTRYILPVCQNLNKHYKRGNYSREKAINAFYPVATAGARLYSKTFADLRDFQYIFNVTARYTTAAELEKSFMDLIKEG